MLVILILFFLVSMITLGLSYSPYDPEVKPYQVVCCFVGMLSVIFLLLFLTGVLSEKNVNQMLGITFG